MPRFQRHSPCFALGIALLATLVVSGCARLPRIDPSGRRLLIWPDPAPAAAPLAGAPLGIPGPGLPGLGNVTAPPVFAGGAPPLTPSGPIAPPAGSVGPTRFPRINRVLTPPKEDLSITPSRLLAPVGSEVILKAGVCGDNGYLRTNRRVEWMLGQEGTGQFVTVGEQGEMDLMRLPWQRPNKHDNAFAVGYTAPFNVCLRRGNNDASDDVQVERGEAWITLTSASEGVSYVTATAPETGDWDARRATATVYWVDARWRLPESTSVQPGQTATLTTTVTRESDGAPISGWIVRYEVLRGETARLGYASGQSDEVETDAQGRASIQVTPTDNAPGSALVRATVIRPATSTPMPAPRLELGGGEVTVDWSPAATPAAPPLAQQPPTPGPSPTPPAPAPFRPPPAGPIDPIGPPADRLGPRLEMTVRNAAPGAIEAGQSLPIEVTLLNTGDEPAENLTMTIEADRGAGNTAGLSFPGDTRGVGRIDSPPGSLADLAPGDSTVVDLNVTATQPGRQCLNVTVGADRVADVVERLCVSVDRPAPPPRPQLRIETALDAVGTVGGQVSYLARVFNDGPAPIENLRVEILNVPQLEARLAYPEGRTRLPNGLAWDGLRIEPRGSLVFEVDYACLAAAELNEVHLYAVVDGEEIADKLDGVEIRTAAPAEPPPIGRPDLEATLSPSRNPGLVGQPATLEVAITNTTGRELTDVQYRLLFDSLNLMRPSPPPGSQPNGNALQFLPVDVLPAGQTHRATIPYTPLDDGVAQVRLETRIGVDGEVNTITVPITIRGR